MNKEFENFTFEEFKKIINKLNQEKIDYFVFGGFFCDAILGELSYHDDLDIVFFDKDNEKIKNLFKKLGYKTYKHGRKWDFRKNKLKIDILFLKEFENSYEMIGNITKDILPKKIFEKKNKVKLNGMEFSAIPYEWFGLYSKGNHHIDSKTPRHKKAIEKVSNYFIDDELLNQEIVGKPENMELIKI